jgi:omega-3 fatty acid desaturase (delta-15 desaturase)
MKPVRDETETKHREGPMELSFNLAQLKEAIPKECFEKNLSTSLYYMFRDLALIFGTGYVYYMLFPVTSIQNVYLQWCYRLVYWTAQSLFFWCLFVVGHDCGHGTFSNSETVNDILGHICHGIEFVPYYPWRLSHKFHHKFHNSPQDLSHPWLTPEKLGSPDLLMFRYTQHMPFIAFSAYWTYLYAGYYDGNHWLPNSELFDIPTTDKERRLESRRCIVSTVAVFSWLAFWLYYFGNFYTFMDVYFIPVLGMGWWVFTITYLQHHEPGVTQLIQKKEWDYLKGALHTVDRHFGWGLDQLMHHITDCHLVHHLFFLDIPHYNLPKATAAIVPIIEPSGYYIYRNTEDFFIRVFKYVWLYGFNLDEHGNFGIKREKTIFQLAKDSFALYFNNGKVDENKKIM